MRNTLAIALLFAISLPGQESAVGAANRENLTLDQLVAQMVSKEGEIGSVRMSMVSRGTYPGGTGFEISGTVRVLGETHFHITNQMTFEEDLGAETERVVTPEGTWIRESDPAFGEVYLSISKELMADLEAARRVLAGGEEQAGAMDNPAKDPLGSAMLRGLNEYFRLGVETRSIEGRDVYVVAGDARSGVEPEPGTPPTDRVEMIVRRPDLAVVQMTRFQKGKEIMTIEIQELQLDLPMEKASFAIDLPAGQQFIDVMEHPPAAAQIRQMLADADRARATGDGNDDK